MGDLPIKIKRSITLSHKAPRGVNPDNIITAFSRALEGTPIIKNNLKS
jgi:hypothetical protein